MLAADPRCHHPRFVDFDPSLVNPRANIYRIILLVFGTNPTVRVVTARKKRMAGYFIQGDRDLDGKLRGADSATAWVKLAGVERSCRFCRGGRPVDLRRCRIFISIRSRFVVVR